jgi:hypothetical protein
VNAFGSLFRYAQRSVTAGVARACLADLQHARLFSKNATDRARRYASQLGQFIGRALEALEAGISLIFCVSGPENLRGVIPAVRFEESKGLRMRQQSPRGAWAGYGQVVLGFVEKEVDSSSLPLPHIFAENPDGKRNG